MKALPSKLTGILQLLSVAIFLAPSICHAEGIEDKDIKDIEGSKALGMGGAYSAIATGPDTIRINPAGIGISKVYLIKAGYRLTNDDTKTYNLSILDYKTSSTPLGISYTRQEAGDEEINYGVLSISNSGSSTLIGLSIKYFEGTLYFEDTLTLINKTAFSYDIGLLMRPSDELNISLVGKNLEKTGLDFVHKTYTAGAAYKISPELTIAADYTQDQDLDADNTISAIGVEYILSSAFSIRGGYNRGEYNRDEISDADYYSAGLSIFDLTGYLEYGYRWNKEDENNNIHSVSISLLH